MSDAGPVSRDIFLHVRLVGRQWRRDLLQLAFVSGCGEVALATFAWSPLVDIQTDRVASSSTLRLLGPRTPSLGFLTPLVEQICRGATLIVVDASRQRRLLPSCCLEGARGLAALPSDMRRHVIEPPSRDDSLEGIDRNQDAVTVAFRLLYLWSGALPQDRHMPMFHERWAGLEGFAP